MTRKEKIKHQKKDKKTFLSRRLKLIISVIVVVLLYCIFLYFLVETGILGRFNSQEVINQHQTLGAPAPRPILNLADYTRRMRILAQLDPNPATTTATTTASVKKPLWPPQTVNPLGGALLPFNRIVAYYGNFYSKQMGVLGEYAPDVVLQKLQAASAVWQVADPTTPVLPAIEYIATTAQGSAGADGLYTTRMPDDQVDKALAMARQINGILILDLQVGLSNLQKEVPLLEKYLQMPDVHLAIDPEFDMKNGEKPGTVIGTVDASDVNYVSGYLAQLVQKYGLPPKVLIVHRFTEKMVTNYQNIKTRPEVQIVMDMDGWGPPRLKERTYRDVIYYEPVQFAGIKLFYKNDLRGNSPGLMTPTEVFSLLPKPIYIQYQ